MLNGAESAVAGAGIAEDHEGGGLGAEALADIGAAGFLADGVNAAAGQQVARGGNLMGFTYFDA